MKAKFIGTSGYSYSYWKNRFYPEGLPASKQLDYYSKHFNTVELNYTFYRFPSVKGLHVAALGTPDDFVFSLKVHKSITHQMRMKDTKDRITEFMAIALEGLGAKLGCVLFQLPPSFSYTDERLNDILNNVPHHHKNVIEFRHASWWNGDVYKALSEAGLTFCSVSFPGLPDDNIVTNDVFYKRMHGVPELFKSNYSDDELRRLVQEMPDDKTCFIYFNNTMFEAGYSNAQTVQMFLNE